MIWFLCYLITKSKCFKLNSKWLLDYPFLATIYSVSTPNTHCLLRFPKILCLIHSSICILTITIDSLVYSTKPTWVWLIGMLLTHYVFCFVFRYGGIYLDSDIVVLKPLSSLKNTVGWEDEPAGSHLNGAVMAFKKHR